MAKPPKAKSATPVWGYAGYMLGLLLVMDILNYVDRFTVAVVVEDIKEAFGVDDTKAGLLHTMFIVGYIVAAPITGYLSDRYSRVRITAVCVLVWSVATVASGLAQSYDQLLITRCFIGIGEAGYLVVAPTLVADSFRKGARGRAMAVLYLGLPVGTALAYVGGGWLSVEFGWREVFFFVGAPGMLAAALCWFLREPERGIMDDAASDASGEGSVDGGAPTAQHAPVGRPKVMDIGRLVRNRPYMLTVFAFTLAAFVAGSALFWAIAYFERVWDLPRDEATRLFGPAALIGGVIGTFAAGAIGDRLAKRTRAAYVYVAAVGYLVALGCFYTFFLSSSRELQVVTMGIGVATVSGAIPSLNTTIANVTAPNLRAEAFAFLLFLTHLLGDAASPPLIGFISELISGGALSAGHGGAAASPEGLKVAMLVVPVPLLGASVFAVLAGRAIVKGSRPRHGSPDAKPSPDAAAPVPSAAAAAAQPAAGHDNVHDEVGEEQ